MSILRFLDPEIAHQLGLFALRLGFVGGAREMGHVALGVDALGCHFKNPIGLAAGFDKDATAVAGLASLGFGFLELGTVTPQPQAGNPKPRLFRLEADRAVINRMGFNSGGIDRFASRLRASSWPVPIGANIGINKVGAVPEQDYPGLVARLAPLVSYIVLNVSSPNTPGLRDLQAQDRLRGILAAIASKAPDHPPLLVKIAPDLTPEALASLITVCIEGGVRGLVVSNTTASRPPGLLSAHSSEPGGLSGAPLFALSTAMLARARLIAGDRLVLIGVGGISTGYDVLTKIRAGATLVQLYTAFAYHGPALIPRIIRELLNALRDHGFSNIQQAVGTDAQRLAGTA